MYRPLGLVAWTQLTKRTPSTNQLCEVLILEIVEDDISLYQGRKEQNIQSKDPGLEGLRDIDRIVLNAIKNGKDDTQKITSHTGLHRDKVTYSLKKLEKQGLITVKKPDRMVERVVDGQKRVFQAPINAELTEAGRQTLKESKKEEKKDFGRYYVRLLAVASDGTEVPMQYKLYTLTEEERKEKNTHREWLIYDVEVEGVSLISNYRSQFNEILLGESPEVLIEKLRKKLQKD